jgi:hypothetical protein
MSDTEDTGYPEKYDGFTVIPGEEDYDESQIVFFNLDENSKEGIPIEYSPMGDMYHVVLFKAKSDIQDVKFDEAFEAIFIDPLVYAKRLLPNFYSMFVRKTDKSGPWFEDYMVTLLKELLIHNLKQRKEDLQSI